MLVTGAIMKSRNVQYVVFITIFVILSCKLVMSSPTTQPPSEDETTPLGYVPEDQVVIIEDVSPVAVVAGEPQSDDVGTTYSTNAVGVADEAPQPLLEGIPQDGQDEPTQVFVKQDEGDTDDEDDTEGEGDDEEEEDQGGPPRPFLPPRPQLVPPKEGAGLYKLPVGGSTPVKVPSISLLQQQKEAAAAAAAASLPSSTVEPVVVTTAKSRIRTTVTPKSTTAPPRRKPSTPKVKTTTLKPLSFAEEFNLTNVFHANTGPQGRAAL